MGCQLLTGKKLDLFVSNTTADVRDEVLQDRGDDQTGGIQTSGIQSEEVGVEDGLLRAANQFKILARKQTGAQSTIVIAVHV